MSVEVKVPVFPESVTDGTLVAWRKKVGDTVRRNEIIADIETDKVVFEVPAAQDGILKDVLVKEGATVVSDQTLAWMDIQVPQTKSNGQAEEDPPQIIDLAELKIAPSAKKMISEQDLDVEKIPHQSGRISKEDVVNYLSQTAPSPTAAKVEEKTHTSINQPIGQRHERRVPMSRLRARIAQRLVEAQQTAAILTTFNEINMQPVKEMRNRYRESFEKTHGVRLGFMSFFVMAAIEALKRFPEINASIEGNDIVYHGYYDIGIAVGSPRGLVVPILRDADHLSFAQIEKEISQFAEKAQNGSLSMEDINGGTFTISNGGIFGSLLSTPILNPPQSGILGMHKVEERAVVENGQVVVRPMMYVALSYDHRIVDGREAVQFLLTIKEVLEDPTRLLLEI